MRAHLENAGAVPTYLGGHSAVEKVHYPGLPDHAGIRCCATDGGLRRDALVSGSWCARAGYGSRGKSADVSHGPREAAGPVEPIRHGHPELEEGILLLLVERELLAHAECLVLVQSYNSFA